jgi:glycerol transport system ATP-binding protein
MLHGAVVTQVQDVGTYWLVTARADGAVEHLIRMRLSTAAAIPAVGERVWPVVMSPHTCYYRGDHLMTRPKR